MTEQTPSGNRWEPADPPTPAPGAPGTPPPAPPVPEPAGRWRSLLGRPGRQSWIAAGLSALVVLVGLGGFLLGRASADDPSPTEVGQQWRHGPGDLDSDGDGGVDGDGGLPDRGFAPGQLPGTQS